MVEAKSEIIIATTRGQAIFLIFILFVIILERRSKVVVEKAFASYGKAG